MAADRILPPPWVSLAAAAVAAVDTCATAFLTDQHVLPADHADERLWGPFAGANFDERVADATPVPHRSEAAE